MEFFFLRSCMESGLVLHIDVLIDRTEFRNRQKRTSVVATSRERRPGDNLGLPENFFPSLP